MLVADKAKTDLTVNRLSVLLPILLMLLSCSRIPTGPVQLVVGGKSNYVIVLPRDADADETRAADFLRNHVSKISGCELPVVYSDTLAGGHSIIINKSPEIATADGFSVTTAGNTLLIKGGNGRGVIYGVTEILSSYLGIRYYSPDFVVVPQSANIVLPALDIRGSSPNTYRNINGQFARDPDYRDFHRLHTTDDMFGRGYYVHTFHSLVPWEEYFEEHPEYYAWMNGRRTVGQLCLTNHDVFELTVKKLRHEMELQPDRLVWSVSQDDNTSYCQCESCSQIIEEEGSASGPIIRFINRVADEFPDKVISTLAYQYSRQAPVVTRPRNNVQIMLCTIELNRSLPIETDPSSASFLKDLKDWGRISNHIYLWDYTVNFDYHITPFPNLHVLQPNIRLFVNNNVKEHFQQSNTGNGHEFSELKSYLLSKLLWNPDVDENEIIREFTDGYYGPAGNWIRKYIYALETEILKTGEWLFIYGPPSDHQNTFLSEENIAAYNRFFDKAEKAVAGHPDYHLHVRTARMPLQYAVMEIGKDDMFGSRGWYSEVNGKFVLNQKMAGLLESFYQTCTDSRTTSLNERNFSPEEYYKVTKRFLDVQVDGNLAFGKKVTADPLPAERYSRGDPAFLTNGVRGADDFKQNWLGWKATDFTLLLDLEEPVDASVIEIGTLWDQRSWILHPVSVTCLVSVDGVNFRLVEEQLVPGDQRDEEVNRLFRFTPKEEKFRYVKFGVKGTIELLGWHPAAGGESWVFVDEIVVR
jgi:hypothetical protein